MNIVDSEASFLTRCNEITEDGSLHAALGHQGLKTFSHLASAVGTPQAPPTAEATELRNKPSEMTQGKTQSARLF